MEHVVRFAGDVQGRPPRMRLRSPANRPILRASGSRSRGLLLLLAACGGPSATPDAREHAFDLTSNTVVLTPTLVKGEQVQIAVHVTGNSSAFPGPDQVPLVGEVFMSVDDPSVLAGGALTGDLPGPQA